MASKATFGIIAAAVVVVAAGAVGATALAYQEDPSERVGSVDVGSVDVGSVDVGSVGVAVSATSAPTVDAGGQQVAALDALQGTLERRGDDTDDFSIGAVELEFGPEEWVLTAGALEDYDGDGTAEELLAELEGLVGQQVTALVRLDDDGDDADVYVLNDLEYRDSAGGPAPWLQTGTVTGDAASPQEVAEAAARAVGDGARVDELDPTVAGDVAWEAEVIAADGREHTVLLNAAGDVLDARLED